jgi:hypothetical protein
LQRRPRPLLQPIRLALLYDALCGVQFKKGEGVEREKLYVVLSDFEDNASKHSKTDAIRCLTEEKVRLFPVLLGANFGSYGSRFTNKRTQEAAREIAEHSGGEILAPVSDQDLAEAFQRIASVLQGAYWVDTNPSQRERRKRSCALRPHGLMPNCFMRTTNLVFVEDYQLPIDRNPASV